MYPIDKDGLIDDLSDENNRLTAAIKIAEQDRRDLAMLIRRLLRRLPETYGTNPVKDNIRIIQDTKDYLVRKGLTGSVLREAEGVPDGVENDRS